MEDYRSDFPTEPIGGGNPYYKCSYCGISVPEINGELTGHDEDCEWRKKEEEKISLENLMKSWMIRIKESYDSPSNYVRGLSVGMKICFDELREFLEKEK